MCDSEFACSSSHLFSRLGMSISTDRKPVLAIQSLCPETFEKSLTFLWRRTRTVLVGVCSKTRAELPVADHLQRDGKSIMGGSLCCDGDESCSSR